MGSLVSLSSLQASFSWIRPAPGQAPSTYQAATGTPTCDLAHLGPCNLPKALPALVLVLLLPHLQKTILLVPQCTKSLWVLLSDLYQLACRMLTFLLL